MKTKDAHVRRLSKLKIAETHIHAAISIDPDLAFEPSVLHLAAAADEILEAILKREGKPTISQMLLEGFQKHLTPTIDRKTFHQQVSRTKNAVKHADVPGEEFVDIRLGQGFFTLLRAIYNYRDLTGRFTPQMRRWFMRRGRKPVERLTIVKGSKPSA